MQQNGNNNLEGNHTPRTINPENYNSRRQDFYVKICLQSKRVLRGAPSLPFDSKAGNVVDSSGQFSIKGSGHLRFPMVLIVCLFSVADVRNIIPVMLMVTGKITQIFLHSSTHNGMQSNLC